jgi:hypothetical protein
VRDQILFIDSRGKVGHVDRVLPDRLLIGAVLVGVPGSLTNRALELAALLSLRLRISVCTGVECVGVGAVRKRRRGRRRRRRRSGASHLTHLPRVAAVLIDGRGSVRI